MIFLIQWLLYVAFGLLFGVVLVQDNFWALISMIEIVIGSASFVVGAELFLLLVFGMYGPGSTVISFVLLGVAILSFYSCRSIIRWAVEKRRGSQLMSIKAITIGKPFGK